MPTSIYLVLFWRNKISSVEYTISSGQHPPPIGLRAKPALGFSWFKFFSKLGCGRSPQPDLWVVRGISLLIPTPEHSLFTLPLLDGRPSSYLRCWGTTVLVRRDVTTLCQSIRVGYRHRQGLEPQRGDPHWPR